MEIIEKLITAVLGGGTQSVIAILLLIIGGLLYDKMTTNKVIKDLQDKNNKVTQSFFDSSMKTNEIMMGLKQVLMEILSKL